jgi:hypothetical protein
MSQLIRETVECGISANVSRVVKPLPHHPARRQHESSSSATLRDAHKNENYANCQIVDGFSIVGEKSTRMNS